MRQGPQRRHRPVRIQAPRRACGFTAAQSRQAGTLTRVAGGEQGLGNRVCLSPVAARAGQEPVLHLPSHTWRRCYRGLWATCHALHGKLPNSPNRSQSSQKRPRAVSTQQPVGWEAAGVLRVGDRLFTSVLRWFSQDPSTLGAPRSHQPWSCGDVTLLLPKPLMGDHSTAGLGPDKQTPTIWVGLPLRSFSHQHMH